MVKLATLTIAVACLLAFASGDNNECGPQFVESVTRALGTNWGNIF